MVVATMVVAACGGSSGENPMAPSPPTDPGNTTATFSSISSQIFAQRCTACHSGSAAEAGLNLSSATAYNALVNVPSSQRGGSIRVVPGNADGSYLVQKLLGDAGIVGQRMPAGGPFLSTDQINLIRQWISAGAQNN
jgi:mono/diheme cytochrome c family protein